MIDYSGSEDDGLNHIKIDEALPRAGSRPFGDGPIFKRNKSFWRAVRRGEVWALLPFNMFHMANQLAAELYGGKIPVKNFLTNRYISSNVMYLIRKNK